MLVSSPRSTGARYESEIDKRGRIRDGGDEQFKNQSHLYIGLAYYK